MLLVYPLVQLVPLPDALWRALPGHGEYAAVLDRFAAGDGAGAWRAISVIPSATEYGWLALLPPLACLLGALRLSPAHVARLLLLLAIFAGAEGVLGLLQVGPSGGGMLYFGNEEPGQYVAIGTFVNRNHLAALLAMTLPVIVGLLVYSMRPGRHTPPATGAALRRRRSSRKRALLFASAVIILVCLLFTRSRAGIASGLVGLACSAFVLVRARAARARTSRLRVASYVVIGLVVISIGVALAIGIGPILRGLEPGPVAGERRFPVGHLRGDAARRPSSSCPSAADCPRMPTSSRGSRSPTSADTSTTRTTTTCRRSWSSGSRRRSSSRCCSRRG